MFCSLRQFTRVPVIVSTRVPVYQLRTAQMVQIANLSDDSKDSNKLWWDQYGTKKLGEVSETVSKTMSDTNSQLMEKGLSQSLQLLEQLQERLDEEDLNIEGSVGFSVGVLNVNLTFKKEVRIKEDIKWSPLTEH